MRKPYSSSFVRHLLLIGLFMGQSADVLAQTLVKRLFNRFLNDTTSSSNPHVSFYPTLAYAPETSFELGASALYLYHANNKVQQNRLSQLQAFSFVTLRGQYGLFLDHTIYGDNDRWYFLGRGRIQRFPILYYGIGPQTKPDHPATVDAFSVQLRERAMRRLRPNLFGGLELDFQHLSHIEFEQPEGMTHDLPLGSNGTSNIGLGPGLIYDSRPSALNPRSGFFGEVAYLNYGQSRDNALSFHNLFADVRMYHPMRKNQVLAWQVYGNLTSGNVPFNQLALLGGETIMRGYYMGRYRDKFHAAAQIEYRWLPFPFSQRFGAVVFAAVGTVAPAINQVQFNHLLPTGGTGIRYLLFKKKDVFLRADMGITREGVGFYILTGESF
ncbi:BamA/TamA family outer membrane protein [Spirosoma sp. BT702]|uniref:BamA/TamA family outer membrane protein n=1 Tax=Spirosoma profusum TaxID=2771354 RepID=A0A927AU25_9BACT|nr:BamA/TamA family outer membrane protein [Spirosoma profusum]MBD2702087.1 BamA/TamA family outer membrane protein [Spirosoma profusum]